MNGGKTRLDVADEIQLLRFEQRSRGRNGPLDHIGDRDAAHIPGEFAGLDLGQVENVVDQLGEPFSFADNHSQIFDDLLLGLLHLAVVLWNEGEQTLFEAAANDLGKAKH